MLWYKSWLETRWRFAIGAMVLICSAAGLVFGYPRVLERLPLLSGLEVPGFDPNGVVGRQIREGLSLVGEYRGYVWWEWFRQNLPQLWTIFAVLLGTGGLLSQRAGGAALFTLSLPVSRERLLGIRAATGLAESLVLALLASLAVPLLSPAIGQAFGVGDALVFGLCLFVGGAVFFSLASLLSTVFSDVWRPSLIVIGVALTLQLAEQVVSEPTLGVFRVMTAQQYFRTGQLPLLGLAVSAAAATALLYAAAVNLRRQDF